MKNAATQELHGYWRSLCRGRAAPERNQIDPAAIRGVLADTFMIEITADATGNAASIRLSGTRMNALFRTELKGLPFSLLWQRSDRPNVSDLLDAVLETSMPAVAGCIAMPQGYPPLDLELILLPLRHKGQTHTRMLGALSPAAVPSWLGLVPVEPLSLTSHRMLGTERHIGPRDLTWRDGAPEMHERRPVRRGHLMVLEGGQPSETHHGLRVGKGLLKAE